MCSDAERAVRLQEALAATYHGPSKSAAAESDHLNESTAAEVTSTSEPGATETAAESLLRSVQDVEQLASQIPPQPQPPVKKKLGRPKKDKSASSTKTMTEKTAKVQKPASQARKKSPPKKVELDSNGNPYPTQPRGRPKKDSIWSKGRWVSVKSPTSRQAVNSAVPEVLDPVSHSPDNPVSSRTLTTAQQSPQSPQLPQEGHFSTGDSFNTVEDDYLQIQEDRSLRADISLENMGVREPPAISRKHIDAWWAKYDYTDDEEDFEEAETSATITAKAEWEAEEMERVVADYKRRTGFSNLVATISRGTYIMALNDHRSRVAIHRFNCMMAAQDPTWGVNEPNFVPEIFPDLEMLATTTSNGY